MKHSRAFPAVALSVAVVFVVLCYWPGIKGGFLFDDFHNLEQLGTYGGVHDWDSLYAYVHSGMSGPLGRPLSLLSFLLDDNTWPSYAPWFKLTNLWTHVLCGLVLCWCNLLILRLMRFEESVAQWMAVFAAACWMLHPLLVSTTLYVVQRMAQLSTLFIFGGLLVYLQGRTLLERSPRAAYLCMSIGLAFGTLLAVLAKENGALLPLLVLVLEWCLAGQMQGSRPARVWQAALLWLPSAAVLGYLASQINFDPNHWPERSFDQPQRLLSESRILWEYLRLLFLPQIEGQGLFQDGFEISRGLVTPWTTLPSVIGILLLLGGSIGLRKKYPLTCFGVLFFFCGHLIESTVVGLELYFEHRNYLSAAFLFLPIAVLLHELSKTKTREFVFSIGIVMIAFLSFVTYQRAELWSDSEKLQLYWAQANVNSPRAQNAIASYLIRTGRKDEAEAVLQNAMQRMPSSAYLNIAYILQKTYAGGATAEDFEQTIRRFDGEFFDAQAIAALRTLVDNVNLSTSPDLYREYALKITDAISVNPGFVKNPDSGRILPYLKAKIYARRGDFKNSCVYFHKAASVYGSVDSILMMVAESANAGDSPCALELLDIANTLLAKQDDRKISRKREDYVKDISYLRTILKNDIKSRHLNK